MVGLVVRPFWVVREQELAGGRRGMLRACAGHLDTVGEGMFEVSGWGSS